MNASDQPRGISIPWASSAGGSYIHTIPDSGATSDTEASFQQGFPPATFMPDGSGGADVDGRDFNYILQVLSQWARWAKAGGTVPYDGTFASAVGGYPLGAIVRSTTIGLLWQSTADGNTSNPDAGGANWIQITDTTGTNSNGRWIKSAGGVITQRGVVLGTFSEGTQSVTFPIPFANSCEYMSATAINANGDNRKDIWAQAQAQSTTGASVYLNYVAAGGISQCDGFFWEAVGT